MSLILVDGSALVYRSHFAFARRPLTSPAGEYTSIAFGFLNALIRLIEDYDPRYFAVVFDLPGKNFRHRLYPAYKAQRKPMPEEIKEQLPRLRELLEAWGLPILEAEDVEADDVMGTMAARAGGMGHGVWLYSGDKDFLQLVDEHVGLLKPGRRGEEITPLTLEDVRRQYGLEPTGLIDVFALAGDQADNIPGAPGIGDKTALKLILQFGSLENLYERLEKSSLTPRLKRILGENRDQVFLSRDLFIIRRDLELPFALEDLRTVLPQAAEFQSLLGELGLRQVRNAAMRLVGSAGGDDGSQEPDGTAQQQETASGPGEGDGDGGGSGWAERRRERGYLLLDDAAAIKDWFGALDPDAPLAVDTETDGLRRDTAALVGISLAGTLPGGEPSPAAYIPVRWREQAGAEARADTLFPVGKVHDRLAEIREVLTPLLGTGNLKVGQNLKFDLWILGRHGIELKGPRFDTMLASYVLDPGRRSHGLDDLVLEYLGHRMMPYKELFEAGDRTRDILGVDPDRLALYAAEDADFTLRLYQVLEPALKEAGMEDLFYTLEMPVLDVLLAMERHGIMLDRQFLADLKREFTRVLEDLTLRIHELAGGEFNIQSPKQLSAVLFERLGLKPIKKTASGWSTDVGVLEALAEDHPLPGLILEYRQVAKLQNTYVETLPQLANPDTGLIHTSYNQAVAATGRLSSSDPNLQNIPIRTELGRRIRQAFIPRTPDHVFLSADYSQVELRLMAHLSQDANLVQAFLDGADIHRRTAALIAGVAEQDVTAEMRSRAKAINFGVIYGMGARALARQIGVKVAEAGEFIESYFATYPGVKAFIEDTREQARSQGWVQTLLGRKRLLPDITSQNNRVRAFQERVAVNTPIQGTAADLIKLAMLRLHESLAASGLEAMMLLQVHDELVLETAAADLAVLRELVREGMEGALELSVPLVVDMHEGRNWAEAHG